MIQLSYPDALRLLKSTFPVEKPSDPGSEHFLVASSLAALLETKKGSTAEINLLDVGTGNGAFLAHTLGMTKQLSIRRVDQVLAIDPADNFVEFKTKNPEAQFLNLGFEEFCQHRNPQQKFDLVLLQQSLYYLKDLPKFFQELRHLLKPAAKVIITLWSEHCTLAQLHQKTFATDGKLLTAENFLKTCQAEGSFEAQHKYTHNSDVHLAEWSKSNAILLAALMVISRNQVIYPEEQLDGFAATVQELQAKSRYYPRVNKVIELRAKA